MKNVVLGLFLLLPLFLHSMEIMFLPPSKSINLYVRDYFDKVLPTVKISELNKAYFKVPEDSRFELLCCMSDDLLLLNRIAIMLPEEVQKYIYQHLLSGNDSMSARFYDEQVLEAFDLTRGMVKVVGLHKPLDSLYVVEPVERLLLLEQINRCKNSYIPVVPDPERKNIEHMRRYFTGLSLYVLTSEDMIEYDDALNCIKQYIIPFVASIGTLIFTKGSKQSQYLFGVCVFSFLSQLFCFHELIYNKANKITL